MRQIAIQENGIHMVFGLPEDGTVKLLHFSALPFDPALLDHAHPDSFRMLEVMATGENTPANRFGMKYDVTSPGYRMQYSAHTDTRNAEGRLLEFTLTDKPTGLEAVCTYQFYDGIPIVRCRTRLANRGTEPLGIEYVSSFSLHGVEKEGLLPFPQKLELMIPHNTWQKELAWETYTTAELGMVHAQNPGADSSAKAIHISSTGNWSTKEYLPMGCLRNAETGTSLYWQIEQNGSWHWELGDHAGSLYLKLSGPTEKESHWWKSLQPGECFESVPAAVGAVPGGFSESMRELTRYRRRIRRPNRDNQEMPVIFNDYMNCLWGDPTTEKELPLIDAAARDGCEYYVIDCGWYSAGPWWDGVGEWLPSDERFPNGIREVTGYIREKGMIPGVWLELEVMGTQCPKAARVPKGWFFQRHGKPILDKSRYQLDFRNPEVAAHADEVVDRLVREYGIGYIKMDYNIEPGIGTDRDADSPGDGLLEHNRAYLAWLDRVFQRHPNLVIENCSSGAMRMDYAMLSRYSIQSTSDQEDYRNYAVIAANAPSGATPEQAAVWSYPLEDGDVEETAFNMVNALLLRVHQSGHLARLSPEREALVREGIAYYKKTRGDRVQALPFWPLGFARYSDEWLCVGLEGERKLYLAVWRRNSSSPVKILPLAGLRGKDVSARIAYPEGFGGSCRWNRESGALSVELPHPMSARILEIEKPE